MSVLTNHPRRLISLAASAAVLLTFALYFATAGGQSPAPSPLDSVDADVFIHVGINHTLPPPDAIQNVALSADAAEQRVRDVPFLKEPTKEPPVLLNVDLEQTYHLRGPYRGLAWVLSLERVPAPGSRGGPPEGKEPGALPASEQLTLENTYFLVVLDPNTGDILMIAEGTQPRR
jgi:hypothetical protein